VPTDPPVDRRRCGQAPMAPAARSNDLVERGRCIHRTTRQHERRTIIDSDAACISYRAHARASRRVALGAHVVHRRPSHLRCYRRPTCCTTCAAGDATLTRTRAMQERRADWCRRGDNWRWGGTEAL